MALLLGLLGVERIVYADIILVMPGMAEPTPVVSAAIGLAILVVAVVLLLGLGWSRWPGVIGAAFVLLQGIAYVAWGLGRGLGPVGLIFGLLEPLLALLVLERLIRRWPAAVAWDERLR